MRKGKPEIISAPEQRKAATRLAVTPRFDANVVVEEPLLSFAKGKKYYIKTYGCQANIRDEEIMSGYLEKAGFIKVQEGEQPDLVILNTCAVRENAEEKIYGEIGKYKAESIHNPDFLLVIAGCVMGENGVAESIM